MLKNWIYFAKMAKTKYLQTKQDFYHIKISTFLKDKILFIESLSEEK